MRILKTNPVLTIFNSYLVDNPEPSTISYLWNFGSLLGLCLVAQIVSGILLAMHYAGTAELAFNSVEHIMRDVHDGWLLRICHANIASFFFICVYAHISRGLYYGSYRSPRIGVWVVGTIIFFLMMATAFLGYVLPFGQMSLWGYLNSLRCFSVEISKISNNIPIRFRGWGPHNYDILSIIFGSLLGDASAEKRIKGVGTHITFYQEDSHYKYILWLHNYFKYRGYCSENLPILSTRLGKGGKIRKIARFRTWTYTSFNWIYEIWYDEGIKKVPICIGNYLTPLSLAIWIMHYGSRTSHGLKLSTNSFTYNECLLLIKVLSNNFSLKASLQKAAKRDQYVIYIWKESMPLLRNLIGNIIIPEMKYKIYWKI
jgi:ubiquinol-cytochrome c reductase cytochrome b subunit